MHPLQPRLDDQLALVRERIFQPAQLRRQNFRLEQAQRIAARHAERFLHDNFVMAARADFADRRKRLVNEFTATPISFSVQSHSIADCGLRIADFSKITRLRKFALQDFE